jgi:predicted dehydrogenase
MAEIFHLKRGDTSPGLRYRLDPAVNLAGASVVFNMRQRDGGPTVLDRAAATIDPADGVVGYDWEVTDTANAGRFEAEFEVTYSDGAVETFPNDGFIVVQIAGDIS